MFAAIVFMAALGGTIKGSPTTDIYWSVEECMIEAEAPAQEILDGLNMSGFPVDFFEFGCVEVGQKA